MAPDSTWQKILTDFVGGSVAGTVVTIVVALMAVIGGLRVIAALLAAVKPWWDAFRDNRSLRKRLGATLYTPADIYRATRYYIPPKCQNNIDPAFGVEPGQEGGTREDLFEAMDRLLDQRTDHKYIALLADSGMGKSAFVLNYYARYLKRRKPWRLEVIPLGLKGSDERIAAVEDKPGKVLFLDALDEDVLAIVDHAQRMRDLCDMTQEFQKVLITCRTQFFPTAEEEPGQTGVLKLAPTKGGEASEYFFHKLYLSPFDDKQVDAFLRKRYPLMQRKKRALARRIVDKIPRLSARPMLLSYIEDLLDERKTYDHSFQLYEKMIMAWLERERGKVEGVDPETLRDFCEVLALEMYRRREEFGGERVPLEEIDRIAQDFGFEIESWQLTGRSLLNRDAKDRFKFAHRSIMEYLFVKKFLALPTKQRFDDEWTDQMEAYFREMLDERVKTTGLNFELPLNLKNLRNVIFNAAWLRHTRAELLEEHVEKMIQEKDFFDRDLNPNGHGCTHYFISRRLRSNTIIFDLAIGRMWQKSGSDDRMSYFDAEIYIYELNRTRFAGFDDWRFPTLEEAQSLVMSQENKNGLHIDTVFDKKHFWIWTQGMGSSEIWTVNFFHGRCYWQHSAATFYVRAVR